MSFACSYGLPTQLPLSLLCLAWFITHLSLQGVAAASITSIVSAVSYFHKIRGVPDNSQHFTIRQLLVSLRKKPSKADHRMPITLDMLHKLIDALPNFTSSTFETTLFSSMFLTAFHFALRVGEITDSPHNLQLQQISTTETSISLSFQSFKHAPQHPGTHTLQANSAKYCAVKALLRYIQIRGDKPGPLYCLHGKPVSRGLFATTLRFLLKHIGLSHSDFNTHSFRIGAATEWHQNNVSDLQIRRMGRWRSDAVLKYIRGNVSHTQASRPTVDHPSTS